MSGYRLDRSTPFYTKGKRSCWQYMLEVFKDELSNGKEALADPCQARNVFLFLPSSCAVMNHSSQQCMLGEMALEEQSWLIRASLNGGRTVVHCTVVHCREY